MENLITEQDAVEQLRALCEEHGGVSAFAEKIGVTVSAVSHQLNGHRPIQGKVAEFMGLTIHRETTILYKKVSS
ncbi:MAG: hypothetical protein D6698_01800 [Gammaproteobacteria bacterium]|nr:MAG: hypothetical protein D6698_01800 [Gammaproteobacteria bacterium]